VDSKDHGEKEMSPQKRWQLRLDLLSELVARAPGKLGRTALMKLAYFLQTLKSVPLNYDFRLYTYGPFDSDVLDDVGELESLGALKSELIYFPSGYGYEFTTGPKRDKLGKLTENESAKYRGELKWVLDEFGGRTAADLELLSTIVFADREAAQQHKTLGHAELARTVKEIKPRFTEAYILMMIRELDEKGLLAGAEQG
jgi:uncharacterized protein YwgA